MKNKEFVDEAQVKKVRTKIKKKQERKVNVLKGVVEQIGNTQETCSGNPATVRRLPKRWVDLFFLKQHERKRNKIGIIYKGVLSHGGCNNREEEEKKVGRPMQCGGNN